MKRIFHLVVFLIVLAAGLTFALKNSGPVELVYYGGLHWQAPLVVVLFAAMLVGVLLGLLAGLGLALRRRRRREQASRSRSSSSSSSQDVRDGVAT
jgi:lipopolysaccharide assembly protein A